MGARVSQKAYHVALCGLGSAVRFFRTAIVFDARGVDRGYRDHWLAAIRVIDSLFLFMGSLWPSWLFIAAIIIDERLGIFS